MACAFGSAQAEVTFHPLIGAGLTVGGDKLTEMQYTNGMTANTTAGGTFQLYGGVEARFDVLSLQFNLGYHFDKNNASNGSVTFERYPVELLAHYPVTENWRLGGGVRHISSAKVHGSGVASFTSVDLGASTGPVVELEYLFSARSGLKGRVAKDTYRSGSKSEVDGTHFGLMWTYYFN